MIDKYNREIDYIRISITDRCNLRCIYCMPEEGVDLLTHEEILSYDEIEKLCRCFVNIGIKKIKITGGEPLVRKGIDLLIRKIKAIDGIESVTLTTNGVLLKEHLPKLITAGLDGINISLDTLDHKKYEEIVRKDALKQVLKAVEDVLTYKELKVKINCVPLLETAKDDIINIAGLAKNKRLSVRFIEMMPIGLGKNFSFYSEEHIVAILEQAYGKLTHKNEILGNGPAHYYSVDGFKGSIGFISAMTHQFCNECNRVRLTSDGFLKTCLHYETGTDLKSLLRERREDSYLEQFIRHTIYDKPMSHNFHGNQQYGTYEQDHMSRIGG